MQPLFQNGRPTPQATQPLLTIESALQNATYHLDHPDEFSRIKFELDNKHILKEASIDQLSDLRKKIDQVADKKIKELEKEISRNNNLKKRSGWSLILYGIGIISYPSGSRIISIACSTNLLKIFSGAAFILGTIPLAIKIKTLLKNHSISQHKQKVKDTASDLKESIEMAITRRRTDEMLEKTRYPFRGLGELEACGIRIRPNDEFDKVMKSLQEVQRRFARSADELRELSKEGKAEKEEATRASQKRKQMPETNASTVKEKPRRKTIQQQDRNRQQLDRLIEELERQKQQGDRNRQQLANCQQELKRQQQPLANYEQGLQEIRRRREEGSRVLSQVCVVLLNKSLQSSSQLSHQMQS